MKILSIISLAAGRALLFAVSIQGTLSAKSPLPEEDAFPQTTITVTFDSKAPVAEHAVSGFLSLINANTPDPPSELIKPLKPRLWKNAYHTNYARITDSVNGFDCPTVLTTLSEHWGLPSHNPPPPPPWNDDLNPDWTLWESFCAYHVNVHLDQGFNPVWNVWNEPDGSSRWWHGSEGWTNLARTYVHAFRAMRQAYLDHPNFDVADMVIAAPGFADWGNAYAFHTGFNYWYGTPLEAGFDGFLNFCTANNAECHVVMWHEFWEDYVTEITPKAAIMKSIVADHMVQHPEINVQRFYVDEMVHASYPFPMDYHLSPGHVAVVLALLEAAGIDGACRACWTDRYGFSGNINFSVDSLLDVVYCVDPYGNPVLWPPPSYSGDPEPYKPRSHYWVHWYYAQFEGHMASLECSYPPQAGFATYDPQSGVYQALLGYSLCYAYVSGSPVYGYETTTTDLLFNGLPNVDALGRLTMREIPPTGWDPLDEPLIVIDREEIVLKDGSLEWTLPEMKRGHAYVIEIGEIEPGPVPDVKVNGLDDDFSLPAATSLSLTVSLDPKTHAGDAYDWWLSATFNPGANEKSFWWRWPGFWSLSSTPRSVFSIPISLRAINNHAIAQAVLSAGEWRFTFAVDAPDGVYDETFSDAITVTLY